jgi:hypothetical protein
MVTFSLLFAFLCLVGYIISSVLASALGLLCLAVNVVGSVPCVALCLAGAALC